MQTLTIGYIGNFRPDHSTENEVRRALEGLGHRVVQYQEDDAASWEQLLGVPAELDLVLWTRTWHLPQFPQLEVLAALKAAGVGTIGFHLDRWWGLDREHQVRDEPFFRCALVVTADGDPGHGELFAQAGVNHLWMDPAVAEAECYRTAVYDRVFGARPVSFVGSWQQYHHEWGYRLELVNWLRRNYQGRLGLWPRNRSVRGQELANLYGSTKVVVGDSCLAGGIRRYWSDRIPETLGRGGFLIHPNVEGLDLSYTPGVHLATYDAGNWEQLHGLIDHYLKADDERLAIAQAGQAHVRDRHTYRHRMIQLIQEARQQGLVKSPRGRSGPVRVLGPQNVQGWFQLREGSSDGIVVDEVWREDVYRLQNVPVAGRTVIDVGANCGSFTVWALAAGATKVHAYEPDLANFHALTDNVEANEATGRVELFRAGVWDAATDELWVDAPVKGSEAGIHTSVDAPSRLSGPEDAVPAVGLLTMLQRATLDGSTVALLKLDCEGCEYPTFSELDEFVLNRVDRIVMEFHSGDPTLFGPLVTALAEHGKVETLGRPSTGGTIWWERYR